MSFLSPLFLVGAAAAAMPIVLHLLKREPGTACQVLGGASAAACAGREHRPPAICGELLLLALRVAALLLLAFAFARPFFARGAALARPARRSSRSTRR